MGRTIKIWYILTNFLNGFNGNILESLKDVFLFHYIFLILLDEHVMIESVAKPSVAAEVDRPTDYVSERLAELSIAVQSPGGRGKPVFVLHIKQLKSCFPLSMGS